MKQTVVMMMIISGLCFLPVCLPQIYHLVELGTTWLGAQIHCRKKYTDLVAVHNEQEWARLNQFTAKLNQKVWIGLQTDTKSWRWSLENPDYYGEGEAAFRMWTAGKPGGTSYYKVCAAMLGNGNWEVQLCNSSYSFFCYNKNSSSFIFVNMNNTWDYAQSYCRNHYTDLASVRNQSENEQLKKMMVGSYAWLGLYRNSWKWSDGSAYSFTSWASNNPIPTVTASCGTILNRKWFNDDCNTFWHFICYTEQVVKYRMVLKVELKKNDTSVDMDELNGGISEKFSQRLMKHGLSGDVKMRWVKQTNGSVHNKDEEEEKEESCGIK